MVASFKEIIQAFHLVVLVFLTDFVVRTVKVDEKYFISRVYKQIVSTDVVMPDTGLMELLQYAFKCFPARVAISNKTL